MIKAYVVKCVCGAVSRIYPPGDKLYRKTAECNLCGKMINCEKGYWITRTSPVEEKEIDLLEVE